MKMRRGVTPSLHFLSLCFLLLSFSSCGKSPLLHHKKEKPYQKLSTDSNSGSDSDIDASERGKLMAFPHTSLRASIKWIQGPQVDEESQFQLKIWTLTEEDELVPWAPQENNKIEVQLWMPDMGHGSAPVEITPRTEGLFEVRNVYFIMPGLWDIHIRLKERNLTYETKTSLTL